MKKFLILFLAFSLFVSIPATVRAEEGKTVVVKVSGLVCDFCARAIEKTFRKQAAVADLDVNLTSKLITITLKPGQEIDDAAIKKGVEDAGYNVLEIKR